MSDRSLIVAGLRTPMGAMNGALAAVPAPELGAACVKALLERTGVAGKKIDEVKGSLKRTGGGNPGDENRKEWTLLFQTTLTITEDFFNSTAATKTLKTRRR